MPDLRPGDLVHVETRDVTYIYAIDTDPDDLVVSDADTWVLEPSSGEPRPDRRRARRRRTHCSR